MLSRSAGTGPFSLPIKELKDKKEVLPEIPGNSNRAIKRYHQLGVPSSEFYGSLINKVKNGHKQKLPDDLLEF